MEDNRSVTPAATAPQPAGKTPGNSNNRVAIIVAAAVAAIFIGVAIYMWSRLRSTESEMAEMVEMMTYEKEQLENEYADVALEMEGFALKTDNDSILKMLDKEQQRVQLLLEELRTVKATNARRIAELKAELASVRKVLVYYVAQVDSLNTVNTRLTEENREVHQRYQEASQQVQNLSEEKTMLEEKVTIASQLEAQNIEVRIETERGYKTKSVRRAAVFEVSCTILKNITAQVGRKQLYLRVTAPDETVLQKSPNNMFMFDDREIAYSSVRDFEYAGEETTETIYYTIEETLWPGDYRFDLFVDGHLIGTATATLKK